MVGLSIAASRNKNQLKLFFIIFFVILLYHLFDPYSLTIYRGKFLKYLGQEGEIKSHMNKNTDGDNKNYPSLELDFILNGNVWKTYKNRTNITNRENSGLQSSEKILNSNVTKSVHKKNIKSHILTHEHIVLRNMLERSSSLMKICKCLSRSWKETVNKFNSGISPLPELGMHKSIQKWFDKNSSDENDLDMSFLRSYHPYPTCYLPPPTTCESNSFSVVVMSYSLKRIPELISGIRKISSWKHTSELILVWNSERKILTDASNLNHLSHNPYASELLSYSFNSSHPLRIFYSLEQNLVNNLLNRYHPSLRPKEEAVLYFDDDGPFFDELPMEIGFELWKRHSDVQVGSFPRNIRFTSQRMLENQRIATNKIIQLSAEENSYYTNNHTSNITSLYPDFTPLCHRQTGDVLQYNYFIFPQYTAHMFLPSGSFLHRNFLCFIWHPVFADLRQYILDHPTHPDDMVISTIVSHLSGKGLRAFPRIVFGDEKKEVLGNMSYRVLNQFEDSRYNSIVNDHIKKIFENHNKHALYSYDEELISNFSGTVQRILLWQQQNWAKMREEAINSIIGYFGSINPGSVGWCMGTDSQRKGGTMLYDCKPEFPHYKKIPWIRKGGLGSDSCTM